MTRLPPPPILEWRELSYWGGRADAWRRCAATRDLHLMLNAAGGHRRGHLRWQRACGFRNLDYEGVRRRIDAARRIRLALEAAP